MSGSSRCPRPSTDCASRQWSGPATSVRRGAGRGGRSGRRPLVEAVEPKHTRDGEPESGAGVVVCGCRMGERHCPGNPGEDALRRAGSWRSTEAKRWGELTTLGYPGGRGRGPPPWQRWGCVGLTSGPVGAGVLVFASASGCCGDLCGGEVIDDGHDANDGRDDSVIRPATVMKGLQMSDWQHLGWRRGRWRTRLPRRGYR